MTVSVIVATYNQPTWLEKVLWGYTVQTRSDFELLIADDGSGPETTAVIERFCRETHLRPIHVWHADDGFRKTEILNRAILTARGDYIIFADGDCIPRNDYVATHARLAEPRRFLSGGALPLSMALSQRITADDIVSGRFATLPWLRAHGVKGIMQFKRLSRTPWLGAVADGLSLKARFTGKNVSTWKSGLIAVNGFDHEMRYGYEDWSVGQRLIHIGYRVKQVRNRAVAFHLDHPRPYRVREEMARGRAIFERIRKNREVRVQEGLDQMAVRMAAEGSTGAARIPG
jgi:glycosyltransferase involved in cell wall biosynthesis